MRALIETLEAQVQTLLQLVEDLRRSGKRQAAPLPDKCPACGGSVEFVKTAEQYHTESRISNPSIAKFNVANGRKRRVQVRHALQTSEALSVAIVCDGCVIRKD